MTRRTAIRICLALLVSAPAASVIAAEGAWLTLAPMPDPRQEVGVAELNGKIYVVGGLPSTTRVQEYDPATDTWRFRASLPVAVDHPRGERVAHRVEADALDPGLFGSGLEASASDVAVTERLPVS